MTKKVYLPDDIPAVGKDILTAAGFEVIVGTGRQREIMKKEGAEANAVLIGTQTFDEDIMRAMPNLQVIARNGVGYDAVDIAAATRRGIYVVNTPKALSSSVAETAVAELLAISKNLYQNAKAIHEDNWDYRKQHPGRDVAGKTVGILGFGRIGQQVAEKLSGFGLHVIAFDPFVKSTDTVTIVDREMVFKKSDYVMIHLPAMPETIHSIGKTEFDMMKNDAYLINMARGNIIVTSDLVAALKNHDIAGAALDVFEEEPLPVSDPLVALDNVLLTPHIASNTVETKERMAIDAAHDIVRVLMGDQPVSSVNQI
ncbi:phosphoglycerate dehydrogenase [Leuconostoc citreum]|uniref:phosphoglycerate dehydrogenase n=1 Tax=Leuconostoc citreum TaxID=33964 RepID=UPI0002466447|nr:phosphoglycerate dehydrogenase [Leuconostoc citreum]MCS8587688.1 3-phosphoglycerate dehydrogenase [Leuconostoc citreum]MCS8594511.1 3-phosphoglycerate dehydrogenase [Leuconostoc citreum]MCS8599292.1 3-phosphoglycerate dehydrogenase [Leuconostoc citreum]CCF23761.1 D-3-phosphoglycerate dehydrogenase [Leuconostoc citreum LBAE C10]